MKRRRYHLLIRRSHRWLGVLLGIQFLFWTAGGLYFSWTNLDEIHGDFQRKAPPQIRAYQNLLSPSFVFTQNNLVPDSLSGLQLINVLDQPHYLLSYFAGGEIKTVLTNAVTGKIRPAISKDEAVNIAAESFAGKPDVKHVAYITSADAHSEYRGKPLPAWKITFNHPSNTNVYVSAQQGKVETFRNNKWRTFDLLWMFHTMDYNGRDDFNNWILRAFSVFGLITILSGFTLFFVSMKRRRGRI